MSVFPPTRHSVIERMRSSDAGARREAFGDLVEGDWKPLYKYVRIQWRLSHDTFTPPRGVIMMFDGLISRWIVP
jgi:hypothetical protein